MVHEDVNLKHSAHGLRVAIVTSQYHESITAMLQDGAIEAFTEAGGQENDIRTYDSPGTFELPVLCSTLAKSESGRPKLDGIVALGCVITGETMHDQYINSAVSSALARLSTDTGIPIGFGVLTCATMEQAKERSGGTKGNKGAEAMRAVIATARTLQRVRADGEHS